MLTHENGIVTMSPGPVDVHAHPRILDPITDRTFAENDAYEGKAGLAAYTETALASGLVVISAMPNESYRVLDIKEESGTSLVQFPISNADRAAFIEGSIATQSRIKATYHLGLDPKEIILPGDSEILDGRALVRNFEAAGQNASALKVFVDISTGGNNVPIRHAPDIARGWYQMYPFKPIIFHAENANVATVLESIDELPEGKNIPIHIAHISSRQELEAVIAAKERGMNVTCEVTPHHLFVNKRDGRMINGYGCMKPTLKSMNDLNFLWANMRYIDIIASDCAPHKPSEKENNTYGVTNHTTMLPLLFGAVEEGRLTLEELHEKIVINPRKRFNIPVEDGSSVVFDLKQGWDKPSDVERVVMPRYGQNIFIKLEEVLGKQFHLLGHLRFARSGSSVYDANEHGFRGPQMRTSLAHLVKITRPGAE